MGRHFYSQLNKQRFLGDCLRLQRLLVLCTFNATQKYDEESYPLNAVQLSAMDYALRTPRLSSPAVILERILPRARTRRYRLGTGNGGFASFAENDRSRELFASLSQCVV